MNRRGFVGTLLGLLGLGAAKPVEPSYEFVWGHYPHAQWTNHPRYNGVPPMGIGNRVVVDGDDVSSLPIFRLITGRRGVIEYFLKDESGSYIVRFGEIAKASRIGHVEHWFNGVKS
jgi:hypothetical protein